MSNPTELPEVLATVEVDDDQQKYLKWVQPMWHVLSRGDKLCKVQARAQPEGEAPQATGYEAGIRRALHICRKIKDSKREHVAKVALIEACEAFAFELLHPAATLSPLCGAQHAEKVSCPECSGTGGVMMEGDCSDCNGKGYGWEPVATLSPLCGAQHAESGKEAELGCGGSGKCGVGDLPCLGCVNCPSEDFAAQQAAAPVDCSEQRAEPEAWQVLEMSDQPDSDRLLDVVLKNGVMREGLSYAVIDWTQVADWRYSAPGTPEAPKPTFPISDDEMAALRRFWECATDGEGYDVEKSMMQRLAEMGLVQRKSGAYYMATEFGLYVLGEYTMERAAQLDGGQEGSGSNG